MFYAILAALATPEPLPAKVEALASIRILSHVVASREEWERVNPKQHRQIIITEADGTKTLVRVIEHQ